VFDRSRNQLVLFGGWDGTATRSDTWVWRRDSGWRRIEGSGPDRRAAQAMVYDERRQVTWLAGGRNLATFYDDLWSFDGSTWTRHHVENGPSPRAFQAAFFEPSRGEIVFFGGISPTPLADTWIWDGRSWNLRDGPGPSARSAYAAAFDRKRGSALFHGGGHRSGESWQIFAETWRWTSVSGWQRLVP
jgi:hypothetical protein